MWEDMLREATVHSEGTVSLMCLLGDVRYYLCTKGHLRVGRQTSHLTVGVACKLSYPILLEWDYPHFKHILQTFLRSPMEMIREGK